MVDPREIYVPKKIIDERRGNLYMRKEYLGYGAFARCYTAVEIGTSKNYAVKAISKRFLRRRNNASLILNEISIHKSLCHQNIVKFHNYFQDGWNVYMILELCPKMTLMDLYAKREILFLYEIRHYMHQLIQGVKYLHDKHIIHRDLKLSNLFLTENLHLRIGDFGLATRVHYKGELKKDYCGTLSYMAPEIINRLGHSYAADIWSMGCIMYILLTGKHAFDEISVNDTIEKIKNCDYSLAFPINKTAKDMIRAMLESDPKKRPKIDKLLIFKFMTEKKVLESITGYSLNHETFC